ncbi:heterokaryon incompatibility protein-domain-containing protein [Neofusicoccum parvum]|uniref:Heterokaryon incompatibility protein-domain-containing protein n=1 Tax=Neofusicoccum parvum TaxID=310453 RepID=A0ACB5RY35_9PEZI|nr:heterokaryon incompatibility protein-domain-containing protein [Neofusicoccum parvum]
MGARLEFTTCSKQLDNATARAQLGRLRHLILGSSRVTTIPAVTIGEGWKVSTISAAASGKFCLSKAALIAADTPAIYPWTPGSVTRVEALWRTLVADHVDRQHPALPHREHDFRRQWARESDKARKSCEPSRMPVPHDARETLQRFQDAESKLHIGFGGVEDAEQESDSANEFGFVFRYRRTSYGRTVSRTDADQLGNGPRRLEVGDQVWVLAGANVPFVFRPQARGGYQFIGEAYVHGIMNGEALDAPGAKSEQIDSIATL